MLKVSEIFTTVQGEGPSLGFPATFVRLMGCNMACAWCDTPYTWDGKRFDLSKEGTQMSPDDILREVMARPNTVRLVVISGGEPLLWQRQLGPLLHMLHNLRYDIEIETAGTIKPNPEFSKWVTRFNVSPKLEHSGNPRELRYNPEVLRELVCLGKSTFKFVVKSLGDFDEIDTIVKEVGIPHRRVYIMPEGQDAEAMARGNIYVEPAIKRGYNLTTRLHVLLWGAKRGV